MHYQINTVEQASSPSNSIKKSCNFLSCCIWRNFRKCFKCSLQQILSFSDLCVNSADVTHYLIFPAKYHFFAKLDLFVPACWLLLLVHGIKTTTTHLVSANGKMWVFIFFTEQGREIWSQVVTKCYAKSEPMHFEVSTFDRAPGTLDNTTNEQPPLCWLSTKALWVKTRQNVQKCAPAHEKSNQMIMKWQQQFTQCGYKLYCTYNFVIS